jgi:hypothetical protein
VVGYTLTNTPEASCSAVTSSSRSGYFRLEQQLPGGLSSSHWKSAFFSRRTLILGLIQCARQLPPARTNPVGFKVLPQKKVVKSLGDHYAWLRNHDGFDSIAGTIYAARPRSREGITFPWNMKGRGSRPTSQNEIKRLFCIRRGEKNKQNCLVFTKHNARFVLSCNAKLSHGPMVPMVILF